MYYTNTQLVYIEKKAIIFFSSLMTLTIKKHIYKFIVFLKDNP